MNLLDNSKNSPSWKLILYFTGNIPKKEGMNGLVVKKGRRKPRKSHILVKNSYENIRNFDYFQQSPPFYMQLPKNGLPE